jgi:hypothetical protein
VSKATDELLAALTEHDGNTYACQVANTQKLDADTKWESSAQRVAKAQAAVQQDVDAMATAKLRDFAKAASPAPEREIIASPSGAPVSVLSEIPKDSVRGLSGAGLQPAPGSDSLATAKVVQGTMINS